MECRDDHDGDFMDEMNWPNKKYNVIYADPPWAYNNFSSGKAKGSTIYGSAAHHYTCLSPEQIKAIPVDNIAAKDCWLFLWATYPNLPIALDVMQAWGFIYKTVAFTWVKTRGKSWYSGLGFYTNGNAEVVLLGTRGRMKRVVKNVKQLCIAPLSRHSEKPDEIRERVTTLCGDVSRIELFARKRVNGWDAWGNEVGGSDS